MDCLKGKGPETYRNKIIAFREALIQCFGTVPFQKSEAFYEVFGNLTPADGADALSVNIVDLIFDNVFCPNDHRYILIDLDNDECIITAKDAVKDVKPFKRIEMQ